MSKSTLGRGLGDLLGPDRAAQSSSAPVRPTSAGLRILIGGASPVQPKPAATQRDKASPKEAVDTELGNRALAALSLIGADVALVAWGGYHTFTLRGPMGVLDLVLCASSVLLAALCGISAARLLLRK